MLIFYAAGALYFKVKAHWITDIWYSSALQSLSKDHGFSALRLQLKCVMLLHCKSLSNRQKSYCVTRKETQEHISYPCSSGQHSDVRLLIVCVILSACIHSVDCSVHFLISHESFQKPTSYEWNEAGCTTIQTTHLVLNITSHHIKSRHGKRKFCAWAKVVKRLPNTNSTGQLKSQTVQHWLNDLFASVARCWPNQSFHI